MQVRSIRAGILLTVVATLVACTSGGGEVTRNDVLGTWGDPEAVGAAHVILTEDGRVAGSDGCNRMMGQWQFDAGTVTFEAVATTRMHCEGVDTSLNRMRTARLVDGQMNLYDEDEALITALPRGS